MAGASTKRSARGFRGRITAALPQRWVDRWVVLGRDLRMVRGTLRGQTPPYLVPRPPRSTPDSNGPKQASGDSQAPLPTDSEPRETRFPQDAVTVSMRAGGHVHQVRVDPGQTLLEAGLEAGVPMPFSCAMGGCATCLVTLVSGEVHIEEPNCLGTEERTNGCILTCVTRPLTPCTIDWTPDE